MVLEEGVTKILTIKRTYQMSMSWDVQFHNIVDWREIVVD